MVAENLQVTLYKCPLAHIECVKTERFDPWRILRFRSPFVVEYYAGQRIYPNVWVHVDAEHLDLLPHYDKFDAQCGPFNLYGLLPLTFVEDEYGFIECAIDYWEVKSETQVANVIEGNESQISNRNVDFIIRTVLAPGSV